MELLKLNDLFWTFQGEGLHAGRRALFVRLPYCNLKCSWCDTEYNSSQDWRPESFMSFAREEKSRFAVITGGEPMMNKQTKTIVWILKEMGFEIACETNGTFPIVDGIDFVTVSPKYGANFEIHPDAFTKGHEFKYVVDDNFDFEILKKHQSIEGPRYSLSPEFNELPKQLERIENYIKQNPKWRLNVQSHKFIGVK